METIHNTVHGQLGTLNTDIELPNNVALSSDPFDNIITVDILTRGEQPTLGLALKKSTSMGDRLQMMTCLKSTPAARIPKWRSTLSNSFPLQVNNIPVSDIGRVKEIIAEARHKQVKHLKCQFATIEKLAMHPQEGIPLMYQDQMNIVAKHIAETKNTEEEPNKIHQRYLQAIEPQIHQMKLTKKKAKLTRRILKVRKTGLNGNYLNINSYNNMKIRACSLNHSLFHLTSTTYRLFGHTMSKMMAPRNHAHPVMVHQECKAL